MISISNFSYLCFERSKTHPEKNIAIPLEKIERIEKSSQSSWMPGGGMIVEVIVQGCDRVLRNKAKVSDTSESFPFSVSHSKAFSFGALTNRDDVYDAVRSSAEKVARLIG